MPVCLWMSGYPVINSNKCQFVFGFQDTQLLTRTKKTASQEPQNEIFLRRLSIISMASLNEVWHRRQHTTIFLTGITYRENQAFYKRIGIVRNESLI